ncbi:MAG: DUF58 domain-containing protein [Flavobacteriaceae bacterium]
MKLLKAFYIQPLFFYLCSGIIVLFGLSYFIPFVFEVAQIFLLILCLCFALDFLLIFLGKNTLLAAREVPEKLSNGDENTIKITLQNHYSFKVYCDIIDEIPVQFQLRDFKLRCAIPSKKIAQVTYSLSPLERGEYHFGDVNVYASTQLRLVAKRFTFDKDIMVKTYPSFKQLKRFEMLNINKNSLELGLRKTRRIGHSMEFEQIKEYVLGDDLRTINWKATAKTHNVMVNLFQDEKSQPVYCLIDKGRSMKMPFEGLSLLDYAINSTLVISNVVLRKHDKAGMLSFSKKVENKVVAERRSSQMQLILESLYNIETNYFESDFSKLYASIKQHITHRSLLLLYTNFETMDGLNRQLPYLKAISKYHLLVVVFFKNTEITSIIDTKAVTIQQVYDKVIAEKFAFEKRLIVNELKKFGIHSILTTPKQLTIDTINKYLEIKARGLL